MKTFPLIVICIVFATAVNAQTDEIVLGKTINIRSSILDEDRRIMVYLPAGYEEDAERYPVLYVLDGRDHFLHTSGAVQFLAKANMAPRMIVVAILNVDRTRDMTILRNDGRGTVVGGGAERFTRFIGEELMPYLNTHYRTDDFSILIGHSLAGLYVVHTLLRHPDLFDAYVAVSPSLWWSDEYLITEMEQLIERHAPLERFLYITYCRENNTDIVASVDRLIEVLEAEAPQGLEWGFAYLPDDVHPTTSYRAFYSGLEWLFRGWRFDSTAPGADAQRMRANYDVLSEKFGFQCKPAERWLIIIGYESLREGRTSDAIEYFEYYVDCYPKSGNSYDSLGEAYMEAGDTVRAIENYERSLELNPDNHNATEMLKGLRGLGK